MSPLTEAGDPFKSTTPQVTAGGKSSYLPVAVNNENLVVQPTWQLSSLLTFFFLKSFN